MFETCRPFIDIYGRKFIAVERVEKTGADGQKYFLYNLYPPTKKRPKRSETNDLGLYYEPYLYMTEEDLRHIFKEYTA